MTIPVLTTARLTLRAPVLADWPGYAAFMASEASRFVGGPKDAYDAWRSFAATLGHWGLRGYGFWAVTRTGEDACLGMIGCHYPATWVEREVGWMVWPEAEGQGIAFEAARAAVAHAFGPLGWPTVVSYVDPGNSRSARLAERLGAEVDPGARHGFEGACLVYRHPLPGPPA